MSDSNGQTQVTQSSSPAEQEWLAIQRRYHAQQMQEDTDGTQHWRCFISLSDPDLTETYRGDSELHVTLPKAYPAEPPRFAFPAWQSRLDAQQLKRLSDAIAARADELTGTFCLRKLLTWLDNNFYRIALLSNEEQSATQAIDIVEQSVPELAIESTVDATPEDATEARAMPTQEAPDAKKKTKKARCRFFGRGHCKSGDQCPFSHEKKSAAAAAKKQTEEKVEDDDATASTENKSKSASRRSKKPTGTNTSQGDEAAVIVAEDNSKPDASKSKSRRQKKPKNEATSVVKAGDNVQAAVPDESKKKPSRKAKAPASAESPATEQSKSVAAEDTRKKQKKRCKFYAKGDCKDGDACKFSHDGKQQPAQKPTPVVKKSTDYSSVRGVVAVLPMPVSASVEVIDLEKSNVITTELASPTKEAPPVEEEVKPPMAPVASPVSSPPPRKPSPPSEPSPPSDEWSEIQQIALDLALKKYPTVSNGTKEDTKTRWRNIAAAVGSKSLNECIDRFKYLSKLVRAEQLRANGEQQPSEPRDEAAPADTPAVPATDIDEASSDARDPRIIPEQQRVAAVETEPATHGAQIRLEELFLYQTGTLIPQRLICQVQCANCPLKFDARLSLSDPRIQQWCPRCSVLHTVLLRPTFAHAHSNVVAYVDTENCSVVDVLPSDLLATCLECGTEVLLPQVVPGRRAEQSCFACHTKLAMMAKRYVAGHVTPTRDGGGTSTAPAKSSKTKKTVIETFVIGQPLPRNGVCEHYKHSFRWFRFQCCGKAFPCDVCHDASDCAEANLGKIASRMICGMCSKEQSASVKVCSCGNEVGRKTNKSTHWEGGKGCRNPHMMSANDKQKFRGMNKTENQKSKRVGAEAKARRLARELPDDVEE